MQYTRPPECVKKKTPPFLLPKYYNGCVYKFFSLTLYALYRDETPMNNTYNSIELEENTAVFMSNVLFVR